jgi:hypothetical protein
MWSGWKRPRRLNYAVNKKWAKTGWKVWQAITHYKMLQKKLWIEWQTKWLENAFSIIATKLKKYWINPNKI